MKKIGIIGGLGPEATIDYYKEIINIFNDVPGQHNNPDIIIYSVNMWEFLRLLNEKKFEEATDFMVYYLSKLKAAGANFAAITANTPHLLFNSIKLKSGLPLISIVESCKERAIQMGLKRCGLFGTKFTMKADFYKNSFQKSGIEIISPNEKEIVQINEKLFSELELGIYTEETKSFLLNVVEEMIKKYKIDSLILGCTEFPIMFRNDDYLGIPFLNTTRLHVNKIVEWCME